MRSSRSRSSGSRTAGSVATAAWGFPPNPPQRRMSRIVPSSAAANTANGAIHATRSKPCAGGAARTVAPYFATKALKICWSLMPAAMSALNSLSSCVDSVQPTWLHSPRICAHPQVHISRWSRSFNRPLGLLAPSEKQMATASTETSTALVQRVKARRSAISRLPSAPEPRAQPAPRERATQQ